MQTHSRASFSYSVDGNVVCIIDHDDGMSVTNDVENVIDDIAALGIDVNSNHIIYRDTDGYWDGIEVKNGGFVCFFPIHVRDLKDAWIYVQSRRL